MQSETALLKGRSATVTEPQDLHAAHLMHVLEAHTTQLRHTDSGPGSQLKPAESGLKPQNKLTHAHSGAEISHKAAEQQVGIGDSQLAGRSVTMQADSAELTAPQGSYSGESLRQQENEYQHQDSRLGTGHLQAAAQPILFPVMPLAAASTATRTAQPAVDNSLQLDISKPKQEAAFPDTAGRGPLAWQAQQPADAVRPDARQAQGLTSATLTTFSDLKSNQGPSYAGMSGLIDCLSATLSWCF